MRKGEDDDDDDDDGDEDEDEGVGDATTTIMYNHVLVLRFAEVTPGRAHACWSCMLVGSTPNKIKGRRTVVSDEK